MDWRPRDSAYACLVVVDAGSGIADTDIEKLFDPFFSSKFAGRGMGLSVVLGILRAHGGGRHGGERTRLWEHLPGRSDGHLFAGLRRSMPMICVTCGNAIWPGTVQGGVKTRLERADTGSALRDGYREPICGCSIF